MATRIVPIGSAAVCLLIVLLSAGVLQPADSATLLDRIAKAEIETVKAILESVRNPNDVYLYDVKVADLLGLTRLSNIDCKPEELAKKNFLDAVKGNFGLHRFCQYYYHELLALCVAKFDSLNYSSLRQHMNRTDKQVLIDFRKYMFKWPLNSKHPAVAALHDEVFLAKLALFREEKCEGKKEEEEKLDMRLESSCKKAYGFLQVYDDNPIEFANLLEDTKDKYVAKWKQIDTLCKKYLEKYLLYIRTKGRDGKVQWIGPRPRFPWSVINGMKYWGKRIIRRSRK